MDSLASNLDSRLTTLLIPRFALPMEPASNEKKHRNSRQLTSSGASSSTAGTQIPGPSRSLPSKSQSGSRKEAKETSPQESGNVQQRTSNPPRQRPKSQKGRTLEIAQANIAREEAEERPSNRASSPSNLDPVAAALARDTKEKLTFLRFSQVNIKGIEAEHDSWLDGGIKNIEGAKANARTRSMTSLPGARRPARVHDELRTVRKAVKEARDEAKTRMSAVSDALHSRPISSPTTRLKVAQAGAATEKAQGISTAYYNREYYASLSASGQHRWNDYQGHVKKAYKASARGTALDAYNAGLVAEYQSKLDDETLAKASNAEERRKALAVAVESRRDFNAAAKIYYLRDRQYRDVRNKFVEGASSEDESHEFAAVPREKKTS